MGLGLGAWAISSKTREPIAEISGSVEPDDYTDYKQKKIDHVGELRL